MFRLFLRRRRRWLLTLVGVACLGFCCLLVVSVPLQERVHGEPHAGYDLYDDTGVHIRSDHESDLLNSDIENSIHAPSLPKLNQVVFNKDIPVHTKHLPLVPPNMENRILSDGDVRGYQEVADAAVFDDARVEYENENEDEYNENEEEEIEDDEYYDDDEDSDLLEDEYYEDENPNFKPGDFDAPPADGEDVAEAPPVIRQQNALDENMSHIPASDDLDPPARYKKAQLENEDILQNLAVHASNLHNSDTKDGREQVNCDGEKCLKNIGQKDSTNHVSSHLNLGMDIGDDNNDDGDEDNADYNDQQIRPPQHVDQVDEKFEPEDAEYSTRTLTTQSVDVRSVHGFVVVNDGVFWSSEVEHFVPQGLSTDDVAEFMRRAKEVPVKEMHHPSWNHCGRVKNQYVILADGTTLCARYRHPHVKLIQGEVMSFHFSHLLGLDCVPSVVLSEVDTDSPQWRKQNISAAGWESGNIVALIQWIDGLNEEQTSHVKMPQIILSAYESGSPLSADNPELAAMNGEQLAELVQWGDMVIFDYITGNYDRVASMQDGADREKRPGVLAEKIRNLRRTPQDGKLWLIDNESGLLDAYELLYSGNRKFVEFHRKMLKSICLFHHSVARKIELLVQHENPVNFLLQYTQIHEPLYEQLPKIASGHVFIKNFKERLKEVYDWIDSCKKRSVKTI